MLLIATGVSGSGFEFLATGYWLLINGIRRRGNRAQRFVSNSSISSITLINRAAAA